MSPNWRRAQCEMNGTLNLTCTAGGEGGTNWLARTVLEDGRAFRQCL